LIWRDAPLLRSSAIVRPLARHFGPAASDIPPYHRGSLGWPGASDPGWDPAVPVAGADRAQNPPNP
jgi:hypothetical protein